jgi:hypothetical protein
MATRISTEKELCSPKTTDKDLRAERTERSHLHVNVGFLAVLGQTPSKPRDASRVTNQS